MNKLDEATIWQKFLEGDESAFSTLFHRHYKSLCNYGFKIIPDKDVVKDCVQDLFIFLWNNRQKLEYTGGIQFYLLKSLRGKLLRIHNKNKKLVFEELSAESDHVGFSFSFEEVLIAEQIQEDQQQQLLKALNELSKRHREVIYLKFFSNLSYEEIADIMSLNYQVTRNYASQAIKSLRKKIAMLVSIALIINISGQYL